MAAIFIILILGLLYINYHARQTGMTENRPLVEVSNSAQRYTIRVMNAELTLNWKDYRRIEPTLQKMTVFIPARARALSAGLHALNAWTAQILSPPEESPAGDTDG